MSGRAADWGPLWSRLVPRLFLIGLICAALYLMLSKLGQVADLVRVVHQDLLRHFFLTLTFASLTGFCLALGLGALKPAPEHARFHTAQLIVVLLLSACGPAGLAYATYATGPEATIGLILGLAGGIAAPMYAALQMCLGPDSGSPQQALRTTTATFALLALAYYVLLFWAPIRTGLLVGPVAMLFGLSAALLWFGLFLATRTPLTLVLISLVLMAGIYAGSYGLRPVRQLADATARPSLVEHSRRWLTARQADLADGRPYPVFFITSDGGGIRSTYWTASVLGALADAEPGFARHVFLLSGVSGGAVGAAVFAAQVADAGPISSRGGLRATAQSMLAQDFLAAPLAQLLTRDPLQSLFCHGLKWARTCPSPPFDRVVALETAFEAAWAAAMGTQRFGNSLQALWQSDPTVQVPALILNATEAHSGEPRLISSFSGLQVSAPQDEVLARMAPGQTLSLSTAAVLSARFPLISTEGEIVLDGSAEHLVDGGYFDNSGGAGALAALPTFIQSTQRYAGSRPFPVALVITNDPERPGGARTWQGCAAPGLRPASTRHGLAGLLGQPIGTLDAGRSHAAESRRKAWMRAVAEAGGSVIELPLSRCQGDVEFPLGWTLSTKVRAQIDDKIARLQSQPGSPFQQVLDLLRRASPEPRGPNGAQGTDDSVSH